MENAIEPRNVEGKIHSSQGEKLVLLKDDYLEDVCALLGGNGKNV